MSNHHANSSSNIGFVRATTLAVLLLAALAFLVGACSKSQGILSISERNEFTNSANQAIDTMNAILQELNSGASSGDFSGVPAKVSPLLSQLDSIISGMETKVSRLSGEPRSVGDQMVAAAKEWRKNADSAIAAGLASDSGAYSTAISTMNAAADRFNSLTQQWNAMGVK
jgi:hypothetical protein